MHGRLVQRGSAQVRTLAETLSICGKRVARPYRFPHGTDMLDHEVALRLDKLYIATRYPNGFESGAGDFHTRREAEEAIGDAAAIIEFCRPCGFLTATRS